MKQEVVNLLKIADEIQRKDELLTQVYEILQETIHDAPEDIRKELKKAMDLLENV